jgi:hypothetical protein
VKNKSRRRKKTRWDSWRNSRMYGSEAEFQNHRGLGVLALLAWWVLFMGVYDTVFSLSTVRSGHRYWEMQNSSLEVSKLDNLVYDVEFYSTIDGLR